MLTFPSFPSDSLYKSFFFGGIILIVSSSYLLTNGVERKVNQRINLDSLKDASHTQIEQNKLAQSLIAKKLNAFDKDLNVITTKLAKVRSAYKSKNLTINQKSILDSELKIILAGNDSIGENLKKIDKSVIINVSSQLQRATRDSLNVDLRSQISELTYSYYSKVYIVMFFLGWIFTVAGGVFWYYFIQQYQDAILNLQYLELVDKLSINKVKNTPHVEPKILSRLFFRNKNN